MDLWRTCMPVSLDLSQTFCIFYTNIVQKWHQLGRQKQNHNDFSFSTVHSATDRNYSAARRAYLEVLVFQGYLKLAIFETKMQRFAWQVASFLGFWPQCRYSHSFHILCLYPSCIIYCKVWCWGPELSKIVNFLPNTPLKCSFGGFIEMWIKLWVKRSEAGIRAGEMILIIVSVCCNRLIRNPHL